MKNDRRTFIMKTGIVGMGLLGTAGCNVKQENKKYVPEIQLKTGSGSVAFTQIPDSIAGMTLEQLRDDYKDRVFNQYLPFWDKGGIDYERGGFMCELNDDGSVFNDEKYLWYQGRGLWVYSFLFNNFGRDKRYLEIAQKTRDFILTHMYLGDGKWRESVNRSGIPVKSTVAQGPAKAIYGALFVAAGLTELYRAERNENDLNLAKTTLWSSIREYESPDYEGIIIEGLNQKGLRMQGHSFMIVWILTNLLSIHSDPQLEELQTEHVNHLINDFWNSKYNIVNETLYHDYYRIPDYDSSMQIGHSIESLWMVIDESLRKNDRALFEKCKNRIRHIIEMGWDYVFEGLCSETFHVFGSEKNCPGPDYDLKVMWAHAELLIATMKILELTGEVWAKEWYERTREFCLKNLANTTNGVWREAVNRFGENKKRPIISVYSKDNFHPIRYLMLNLLSIERMIQNNNIPALK